MSIVHARPTEAKPLGLIKSTDEPDGVSYFVEYQSIPAKEWRRHLYRQFPETWHILHRDKSVVVVARIVVNTPGVRGVDLWGAN